MIEDFQNIAMAVAWIFADVCLTGLVGLAVLGFCGLAALLWKAIFHED